METASDAARIANMSDTPLRTDLGSWVPVTEALPKSGVKVLGFWKNALGKSRRTCVEYVAPRTRTADGFWDDTPDDWFDTDESGTAWVPSDWYECVEGADEYPYTPIPVTHWTTLPECPNV